MYPSIRFDRAIKKLIHKKDKVLVMICNDEKSGSWKRELKNMISDF